MFSVIIPLYNKAPYVEKAIRSVIAQTYQEFELIIIDDGSTDNSLGKVQKFKSSKVQIITQGNSGVSTTRNNGVSLANYNYIAFLDADDWWEPTFLEEMKRLIEEFPNAGIYGSSYYKVKNGKHIPANIGVDMGFKKGTINYFEVYAKTMWMPLTSISVVIPKKVCNSENGFKPALKLGEDFDLWVRIANKYPVVFLNKPLSYYNQDVDVNNREVGVKLYNPEEHMLFTDYGALMENKEFKFLYEKLALYGLLPYYMNDKNIVETKNILSSIDWEKHEKKYFWYYMKISKFILRYYFDMLKAISRIKKILLKLSIIHYNKIK